jgi:hypothetical protein
MGWGMVCLLEDAPWLAAAFALATTDVSGPRERLPILAETFCKMGCWLISVRKFVLVEQWFVQHQHRLVAISD